MPLSFVALHTYGGFTNQRVFAITLLFESANQILEFHLSNSLQNGPYKYTCYGLAARYVADRTPYRQGIQMDKTAFPILLVNLALRENIVDAGSSERTGFRFQTIS